MEDEMIRDRIVIGVRDNHTRKKLLQEKNLDLQRCIDICRSNEKSESQLKSIADVHHVKFKQKVKQDNRGKTEKRRDTQSIPTIQSCRYCGRTHPRSREKCPAFGQTCNSCGEQNHFERKCPNKEPPRAKHREKRRGTWNRRKSQVHDIKTHESDSSDELVLVIEQVHSLSSKRHTAVMNIQVKYVEFQLDNGSTANILPAHVYVRLTADKEFQNLKKTDVTLQMYNKTETKALGTIRMSVRNPCNRKKYNLEFLIVPGKELHCILGKRAIEGMELITVHTDKFLTKTQVQNDVISQIDIKEEINEKYANVFKDLGKLDGKLHLEVKDSVRPVQLPPRKIPLALKPKVKEELNRLEKLGVIKPVNTPTDWVSALVVAPKRNGDIRLCIDPKPLNEALMRNHYPTPTIEDILPDLHQARIFSIVDAKDGFWHIELDSESSYLTTFATPWGKYRWLRMPFGISVAPEEFQRRVDDALSGIPDIRPIHDDVLIYGCGETDEEAERDHDVKFRALMQRCMEKNIRLNQSKMKLKLTSVTYLGYVISKDGLSVDPQKLKAIHEMPTPEDKAGIQTLAAVFGMEHFENYTYGRHVNIQSDHKPLEIIARKNLHSAPKRLQRMLLRLQKFDYSIEYKKGTEMYFADTLSRAYLIADSDSVEENIHDIHSINHRAYLAISEERYSQIKEATERDDSLQLLKKIILEGWPDSSKEVHPDIQVYFPFREELVVQNGVIYKAERVVVPKSITHSIDDQQEEPMISHEIPARPWQTIGCDLFECEGKDYLILADYYSDYFEVERLHGKTGSSIIRMMKSQFARHGIPDRVISDNGPPFGSREFAEFSKSYEFEHVTSSPRYAQSNGKAENSVKIAKRLIHKCVMDGKDPFLALLDLRNTPTQGIGYSPAQRIFGRRTKTLLPVAEHLLRPRYADRTREKLFERKERQTYYYNRGAKELKPLSEGDIVRIRPTGNEKGWKKAFVQEQSDVRSYKVRTEDGRVYRCNRRHLRFSREPFRPDHENSEPEPLTDQSQRNDDPVPTIGNSEPSPAPPISELRNTLDSAPVQRPKQPVSSSPMKTRSGRVVVKLMRYRDV
ncbi:uncharacterized protein K02A2.6-like [Saccostrea cucullata]|uniref:uncharacterized protein K02A2.6-like n=1 Tax=Saccostrea cuccullata TaxID=36930 RepID=UPI002ED0B66F